MLGKLVKFISRSGPLLLLDRGHGGGDYAGITLGLVVGGRAGFTVSGGSARLASEVLRL